MEEELTSYIVEVQGRRWQEENPSPRDSITTTQLLHLPGPESGEDTPSLPMTTQQGHPCPMIRGKTSHRNTQAQARPPRWVTNCHLENAKEEGKPSGRAEEAWAPERTGQGARQGDTTLQG